jgi:hypothetical protein
VITQTLRKLRDKVPETHLHRANEATHLGYLTLVFLEGHSFYAYLAGAGAIGLIAEALLYGHKVMGEGED